MNKPVLAAFLLLAVSFAHGEGDWAVFHPPAKVSFSLSAPVKFQKVEGQEEWRGEDGQGRVYSVGFGFYSEPQRIDDPQSFMLMMIDRLAVNTHSRVAYSWFFKYQDAPACEYKLVDLKNQLVGAGRYYLVGQWFYFQNYSTSVQTFDVKSMKRYFDSFQMINPDLKALQPGP